MEILTRPTMVKRALIYGINDYGDPASNLRGCVPDAFDWKRFLVEDRGWDERNISLILDRDATRVNILNEFRRLRSMTTAPDMLGLIASGHGSNLPDHSGDEPDGRDEVLVMADALTGSSFEAGCIRDDDLAAEIAEVPRGALVFGVADTCYSESLFRAALALGNGGPSWKPRFLPPPLDTEVPLGGPVRALRLSRRFPGRVTISTMAEIFLSGCGANQTSADAVINGQPCGAMSYFMKRALRSRPTSPIGPRHASSNRDIAAAGYPQIPHLEGRAEAFNSFNF